MVCLSMFLAQVSPMSAGQNSMIWIEICGDHGAEIIQVEIGGASPESDPVPACAHCSYCLVEVPVTSDTVPVFKAEIPNLVLMESAFPSAHDFLLQASKQYCSQCRGPPNGNTYNLMISVNYAMNTQDFVMPNIPVVAS